MILPITIAGTAGYVLGSVPFGYLVARAHGVNIFEVGSRNPGATNVQRTLGRRAGTLVLVLDMLKGALATLLPLLVAWLVRPAGEGAADWEFAAGGVRLFGAGDLMAMQLAGMAGSLLGHSFSCFTGFRGGKGVATGAGGFFVLVPLACTIAAGIWVLGFFATRYVSLASMLSAVAIPVAAWFLGAHRSVTLLGVVIAAFVLFRHRENIRRLSNGTEHRFVRKRTTGGDGPA